MVPVSHQKGESCCAAFKHKRVTKLSYLKHLLLCQVIALEKDQEAGIDETGNIEESLPGTWELTFEEDRKEIIMLWHQCHASIIHRTRRIRRRGWGGT
ncbi:hypothetical protein ACFX2I_026664 [Malus domestica]